MGNGFALIAAVSTTDSGYKGEENMTLQEFFQENPRGALAFSGGVDSAYLMYAAKCWSQRVKAYYVHSAFQPAFELRDAEVSLEMPLVHVEDYRIFEVE